jgi:hypothetical protein
MRVSKIYTNNKSQCNVDCINGNAKMKKIISVDITLKTNARASSRFKYIYLLNFLTSFLSNLLSKEISYA